jgi:hypothetical protein
MSFLKQMSRVVSSQGPDAQNVARGGRLHGRIVLPATFYGGGTVQRAANEVTALHGYVILSTGVSMEQAS